MSALRKTMEYLGLSDVDTHAPRASEQYVEEYEVAYDDERHDDHRPRGARAVRTAA